MLSKATKNLLATIDTNEDYFRDWAEGLQEEARDDLDPQNFGRWVDSVKPTIEARAVRKQQVAAAILGYLDGKRG